MGFNVHRLELHRFDIYAFIGKVLVQIRNLSRQEKGEYDCFLKGDTNCKSRRPSSVANS